jgi:type IV pilus assembly protein PilC
LLKGEKISDSFKNHWAVREVAYYMIVTGESTGELAEMLDKVGDYYNKLQKNMVNQLKVFIEPVMIILLAIIVGFILVAIVVPMFAIYETIQ